LQDTQTSEVISSLIKTINPKETPNPTCFSNLRNKQYMTQDDFAESFLGKNSELLEQKMLNS
jgi:hypothetical protein